VVAAIYPLSEVAPAHTALQSGHTHGKIALVP
jgi:Zinc-binding dehydrogenase